MTNKHRTVWVIVLAEGDGSRPGGPAANAEGGAAPGQYGSLKEGPSPLQLLLQRTANLVPRERIVVVVNRAQRHCWEAQLSGLTPWSTVVQPEYRGTGFSVLLPLLVIARVDPTAMVVVLSSDHYAQDDDGLAVSLRHAVAMEGTDCDKLTILCTSASTPGPDPGHSRATADSGAGSRAEVNHFAESGRELTARLIHASSGWKTGIFSGCLQAVLNLYPRHVPGLLRNLQAAVKHWADPRVPSRKLEQLYACHPAVDFWHDVLKLQPARVRFQAIASGLTDTGTVARAGSNFADTAPIMVPLAPEPSGAFAFLLQAARHSALPLYGARF